MIKLENCEIMGWETAIRGMRNPMNSWVKSDSKYCSEYDHPPIKGSCQYCPYDNICNKSEKSMQQMYLVGSNDYDLMIRLRNAGTDHRKFMRMIVVYVDITAPLYWWKEFDTYKIGTVANSCSTMHKIAEKEFMLEDFSHEHLISEPYDVDNDELIDGEFEDSGLVLVVNNDNGWLGQCYHTASGNKCVEYLAPKILLDKYIISALNASREAYLKTKDKKYWWQMIQLLPSSYNQKRTVMLNYEVLANIYKSRKNHKLDEWVELCKWIESLPYSELITGLPLNDIPICNDIIKEATKRMTNEGENK